MARSADRGAGASEKGAARMEEELARFKDPVLARRMLDAIAAFSPDEAVLMEVCGTHTVSIARSGIRDPMPGAPLRASGRGCRCARWIPCASRTLP